MTDFSRRVIAIIQKIPKGQVATYGQIAKLAGRPHGARGVSWILSSSSKVYKLPWHRVLNSRGRISFQVMSEEYARQKKRLIDEGIEFSESGGIDLKVFGFKKVTRSKPRFLSPKI
ncbi:MAG: MGMT family protein [Bdellovibrionota bacterium]